MLPPKLDVKLEGNLTGQKIQMGIDTTSLAHLQKLLTDLYSDPIGAVVREYSTNAWDSHIEAGQTRPIEVTTPSAFSPFFKVKDFGVGLSIDDIRNIYSLYGASTKRGTNEQTGMLGLGCKSALTYTNQFTIVAIKDGIKSSVVVSRDENNVGAMQVVASVATDEPNGVEISIPVGRYDVNEFGKKAREFFSYWKPDRVLLDGEAPETVKGNYLNENILISEGYQHKGHKLVMGGVAYNLSYDELFSGDKNSYHRISPNINYNRSIICFVDMGEVDFTPAREELHYTNKTKAKLAELVKDFNVALEVAILKDIHSQPTHAEALKCFKNWDSVVNKMPKHLTYKGVEFPEIVDFEEFYSINSWSTNSYSSSLKRFQLMQIIGDSDYFIVTGKPVPDLRSGNKSLTTNQKAKLRVWAKEKHNIDSPSFIFSESDKHAPWTDGVKHVEWQDILDQKLPRKASSVDLDVYYRVGRNGREDDVKVTDIDTNKTILWANITDIPNERMYSVWQWTDQFNCEVIIVAKNKQKKFHAAFPNSVHYAEWVRKEVARYVAALTPENLEIIGFMEHQNFQTMEFFDREEIKDMELRRVASLAKKIKQQSNDPASQSAKLKREFHKYLAMERSVLQFNIKEPANPAKVVDKYPLMGYIGQGYKQRLLDHIILYINAVYDAEQANQTN